MNISSIPPLFCAAAFCLLPAHAEPAATPAPKTATPLAQAKSIAEGIHKAMDSMITAVEKTTDEKTAHTAADAITASTAKIMELSKSGRELKDKLSEADKAEMEKTMMEMNMAQYNQRLSKAFMKLAEKPELLQILQPAIASFTAAAMQMASEEAGQPTGDAIRGRDKGAPRRLLDQGGEVEEP